MRKHRLLRFAVCALLAPLLTLAACGSQGYAPKLGSATTVSLKGTSGRQLGSATFTPTYATHLATYYKGKEVPFAGAQIPLELRSGSCTGKLLANLTDIAAAPIANGLTVSVDPRGGVDVATPMSDSLYVVVRDHANDINTAQLACGHPLSGRRQYFDLYTPGQGSNGYELGITMMEPIVATSVSFALASPATQAAAWSVRANGCSGQALAQGQIAAGATSASGIVFAPLSAGKWTLVYEQGSCAQVVG